jgi:hypothetical protein
LHRLHCCKQLNPKCTKKQMQNNIKFINCTIAILHSSALWASQTKKWHKKLSFVGVLIHPYFWLFQALNPKKLKALFLACFQIYACAECCIEHGSVLQKRKQTQSTASALERCLMTFLRQPWELPPPPPADGSSGGGSGCLRRAAHKARWVVFSISQFNGLEALMGKLGHFYFNIWIQVKNGKLYSSRSIKWKYLCTKVSSVKCSSPAVEGTYRWAVTW